MVSDPTQTTKEGEANPAAKLTEEDVRVIRRRLAVGKKNRLGAIAKDYGVSPQTIDQIANRKTWGHVE